jgi:hypothetical protein
LPFLRQGKRWILKIKRQWVHRGCQTQIYPAQHSVLTKGLPQRVGLAYSDSQKASSYLSRRHGPLSDPKKRIAAFKAMLSKNCEAQNADASWLLYFLKVLLQFVSILYSSYFGNY